MFLIDQSNFFPSLRQLRANRFLFNRRINCCFLIRVSGTVRRAPRACDEGEESELCAQSTTSNTFYEYSVVFPVECKYTIFI